MRQKLVSGVDFILAISHHFGNVADGTDDGLAFVELNAFLTVVAVCHSLSRLNSTSVRQNAACNQIQESRLPHPVLANQADALTTLKDVVEILQNGKITVRLRHVAHFQNLATKTLHLKAKLKTFVLLLIFRAFLQVVKRVDTAL